MLKLQDYVAPVGRVLMASIFLVFGIDKVANYEQTVKWMEKTEIWGSDATLHGTLLPVVIGLEILGALAIIVGFQTRFAAALLAGFSVLTAILFHANLGDSEQLAMFMRNIAIAGGFLFIFAHGAGNFSIDNK